MKKRNKKKKQTCSFPYDHMATTMAHKISLDLATHPELKYGDPATGTLYKTGAQIFCQVQSESTLKKYVTQKLEDEDVKEEKTYAKFRNVNDHMVKYCSGALRLPDPTTRIVSSMARRDKVLLRARAIVRSLLTPFTEDEWFTACKNSSGSTIGVPYVDTTDAMKFTYPLSCTQRVKPLFQYYLGYDSCLNQALETNNAHNPVKDRFKIVEGSRATTVPKNESIRRMIAVEPTLNMFFQQGLMTMMYARMKEKFLDVESLPQIHRKLAHESSITGRKATIDWSSASDCVSYDLMKWLLPHAWFTAVDQTRSPAITIAGEVMDLGMISTMGNAVTFPLETIVFWSIGHATRLENLGTNSMFPEWNHLREVSVFGDDCIVDVRDAELFIEICTSVGFIINNEKSFYDNYGFRESCGGDYQRGYDVRPFHLKAPTSLKKSALEPWLYNCLNKVVTKYISYFGNLSYIYSKEIFQYVFSLFKKYNIAVKLVPTFFPDDAGLKIAFDLSRFMQYYSFGLSPISENIHGEKKFNFCRFTYWEERPRCDLITYSIWLKKPGITNNIIKKKRKVVAIDLDDDPADIFKGYIREKGSYVVGASLTSFWYIS